jgi:3-polyprenyl-4-hydroxybenzoate decarboxylase
VDDMVTTTVGRALLRLGLDNAAYVRWTGLS